MKVLVLQMQMEMNVMFKAQQLYYKSQTLFLCDNMIGLFQTNYCRSKGFIIIISFFIISKQIFIIVFLEQRLSSMKITKSFALIYLILFILPNISADIILNTSNMQKIIPQNYNFTQNLTLLTQSSTQQIGMQNDTLSNLTMPTESKIPLPNNSSNYILFQISQGQYFLYNSSYNHTQDSIFCQPPKIKIINSCFQIENTTINTNQTNLTQLLLKSSKDLSILSEIDAKIVQDQILQIKQNLMYQNLLKNNPLLQLRFIRRSFNGTGNNPLHFDWGSRLSTLRRKSPRASNYTDQAFFSDQFTFKPRDISNLLGKQTNPNQKSQYNFSMLFVTFGQFVTHELDHTPEQDGSNRKPIQYMNITVPTCDKNFDPDCTGDKYLVFKRSQHIINATTGQRQQITNITSWIDGSVVYGNDISWNQLLRSYKNGKLIQSSNGQHLLGGSPLFIGGDARANQNVALTALHVLFMRQHNRKCDQIKSLNPLINDDDIFQVARNYVTGLLQKIMLQEYLPLLIGKQLFLKYFGQKRQYDITLNPNIYNQYSTTVFRFGHMTVNDILNIVDQNGDIVQVLKLRDMFFNPAYIKNSTTIDNLFRGMMNTFSRSKTVEMSNQLRNFLIPNANQKTTFLDLFSFNVQRGRDHQIPDFNTVRQAFGLQKLDHFCRMGENITQIQTFQDVYRSVNNCDPWVGICGQKPLPESALGELGATITAQTFYNLIYGDRFWYQFSYPQQIINQIKNTTFRDIILRNTNLTSEQVPQSDRIFYCN